MPTDIWRVRAVMQNGELYLCRADVLDAIQTMADRMPNGEDRAVAQNLVSWLRQGTHSNDGGADD